MPPLFSNGKAPIRTGATRPSRMGLAKSVFSKSTPQHGGHPGLNYAPGAGTNALGNFAERVIKNYTTDVGDATSRIVQDTFLNGKGKSSLINNSGVNMFDVIQNPSMSVAKAVTNNFMNNSDFSQMLAPGDIIPTEKVASFGLKAAKNPIVRAGVKGAFEAGLSPKNQLIKQLHMGVDPSEAVNLFKDMFRGGKDAIANERFMQGTQHGETDILSPAQEAALKQVDMPEVNSLKHTVHDARELVDAPQTILGSAKKKRTGEVPVHIDSQETANQIFFGDNVMDAGKVGHSVSSNPEFVGTTAHVGRKINFVQLAKDQVAVARNGVKQRYGNRAPINGAGPNVRASWAINSLNNFAKDFGAGTARILRSEGRKSIGGEFDEASTIPQTIQHDHTVVSPTDLKAFEEETKLMRKELGSSHPDIKERIKVARDMSVILADSRNLVPVHRNPNILLSSFDRERLLNDPDFANQVGINENNLGDIWRIMSDANSGYRKSVNDAYSFARQGGRENSVAYWQNWQHNNLQKTLTRRNQRLAQAGIKLD